MCYTKRILRELIRENNKQQKSNTYFSTQLGDISLISNHYYMKLGHMEILTKEYIQANRSSAYKYIAN